METRLRTPEHIFESYVEYIRPNPGEEPKLKFLYPKDYEFDEDTKKSLTSFLFPLKDSNTNTEEHFTFTLTNIDGQFRFGFCRYPAIGDVCMCILSDLPWFKVFYRIMDKISDMHLNFQSELVQPFLQELRIQPIPNLATDFVMTFKLGNIDGQVFTFPLPSHKRLPEIPTDHNLTQFYLSLHYEVFLCLFANLMFERRIIITSNSLSMLSSSIHCAASLLYPLFWQHIFIPITPPHLIDYCTAPMPFLMGVHSSILEQVKQMPINDAVILDIDQNELETPYAEDLLRMPPHVISSLRHKLKKKNSASGDTVTRALLNCMVTMFGGYRKALKMREGQNKVEFDEESFLQSRPHMGNFLSDLFHFQHFQQFINNRIDRLSKNKERDLFDEEVILNGDEDKSKKNAKQAINNMTEKVKRQGIVAIRGTETLVRDIMQGAGKGDLLPSSGGTSTGTLGSAGGLRTYNGRPENSSSSSPVPRRPPRPVISYESYKKQKEKLRRSLLIQGSGSLYEEFHNNGGGFFNEDAVSLESKESVESGDVCTGVLVDLNLEEGAAINRRHSIPVPTIIRPLHNEEDDTDSDSLVSSSSGNSDQKGWEDTTPTSTSTTVEEPPKPPPRVKHNCRKQQKNEPKIGNAPVGELIDLQSEPNMSHPPPPSASSSSLTGHHLSVNPRRDSPSQDLASDIAEALISKRYSDPVVASNVCNTGQELLNSVDTRSHSATPGESPGTMMLIPEGPANDPWKPVDVSPNLKTRAPPPSKPPPYMGTGPKLFMEMNAKRPGAILAPNVTTMTTTTNNDNTSQDPFNNIFGNGGLHGYVKKTNDNSDHSDNEGSNNS